jgi:hypothetical protein
MNLNVQTNVPPPTSDDYVGFSIMHATDPPNCVPISLCYSNGGKVNPYQPKEDDQAALARLYPGPVFSTTTARIHGSVYFANSNGQPGQGMQGVNVVARWIDPNTNLPSRAHAAASVSGFLFAGNVGTTVTGFNDSTGQPFNRFGSNDAALEGFFELAGLQIPNGGNSAQFQLTVETLDPFWSNSVGPYQPWQVQISGSVPPIIVSVTLGLDTQQDIVLQGSALQKADWFKPTNYQSPAPLPIAGDWAAALGPYGNLDYFWFSGQANRTLAVLVTALDDLGAPSESKAQPVIGMWALSDPGTYPAPANTPSPFNSAIFGTTILNAQLLQATNLRVGIADIRGDGRPDYRYHARVLYGDHIMPARASVSGGTGVAITGFGFQANTATIIGGGNAQPLAISANQLLISAPPRADGVQDLALADPPTQATSVMSAVLTYGAGPNDTLRLLEGSNPRTPVGGQAPNPVRVQVLAPDGITPVSGASVFFTSTPAASFSACSGGSSCTVLSDQSGQVSTFVTVLSNATITITAQLAPASYKTPQQVQTTLATIESSLDLALVPQRDWVAQGASAGISLTARVLKNGVPLAGQTVNFSLYLGTGTINPPSPKTDNNGYARTTLTVSSFASETKGNACVGSNNNPCLGFDVLPVPLNALKVQAVAGNPQSIAVGQSFQPVAVRVTDGTTMQDPVLGASVEFQTLIGRTAGNQPIIFGGDTKFTRNTLPIILGSSQNFITSDANGLASLQPSTEGFQGALAILGMAAAGSGEAQFVMQSLWPPTQ